MNIANRYSLVIKQMRQERRTRIPFGDRAPTRADLTTIAAEPITLDPRLELLKNDRRFAKLLRIDDPVEQDAVLEAMQTLITRCGYHQRSAQSQQGMINRRAVRNWRAAQHPARRRGRPLGAQNFAARQFGLGLAMIWWEHTGRGPSGYERGRGEIGCSYVEFVEMIVEAVPTPARRTSSSALPGTDYLVRTSIKDFRAARNAPEEYRQRGLIDEGLWPNGTDPA